MLIDVRQMLRAHYEPPKTGKGHNNVFLHIKAVTSSIGGIDKASDNMLEWNSLVKTDKHFGSLLVTLFSSMY